MTPKGAQVESVFPGLHEIVRETARRLGKEVRFHVSGEAPKFEAADRSHLWEALVHALRNAVDHGIEATPVRTKAGKPAIGTVRVEFSEENGETVVAIRDDGPGVDLAAVSRRAVGLGIVGTADSLSEREALALLFQPGFSTKKVATEVSGRGIGLDVVQAVVESLAGKVEIDTARGKGTAIILRIPRKTSAAAA